MSNCVSCGEVLVTGDWPFCPHGRPHGGLRIASIHTSERTTVYRNPRTGEIRYPARNDQPIHPKFARQGYERVELSSAQSIREFEKSTGRVHERSHCDPGSATAERSLATGQEAPNMSSLDENA